MRLQKKLYSVTAVIALLCLVTSCQKFDRPPLGDYKKDPPGAGTDLKLYMAFDGTEVDSIRAMFGVPKNITYVNGISGKAMKGATNGWIEYPSPSLAANIKAFSVSLWINTQKHDGGAQNVFMIPNSTDFWGNMFMLIEGNNSTTDNSMLIKFHFGGQWIEFTGANRFPDMYGAWKHIVFTYDPTTSKFFAYLNGSKLNLPASITDRKKGGNPLGSDFTFKGVSKFIIGGYQQHLGISGSPDSWMLPYTGLLDQFRIYGKALSDAEVSALHASKL